MKRRSKNDAARSLPVGTWFVHPEPRPSPHRTHYFGRLYRVLPNQQPSEPFFKDIGLWAVSSGANAPQEAYARLNGLADALNAQHADDAAGRAYLAVYEQARLAASTDKLFFFLKQTILP